MLLRFGLKGVSPSNECTHSANSVIDCLLLERTRDYPKRKHFPTTVVFIRRCCECEVLPTGNACSVWILVHFYLELCIRISTNL